jgi:hypothetical protein
LLLDSDRLNRWLTLLANTGVLVGIILLIIELDQNRDMMRAQIRNEISRAELDMLASWSGDPALADAIVRANRGDELSAAEQFMVRTRSETVFRLWQNIHYQYRQGLYDESEFEASIATFSQIMSRHPSLMDTWCQTSTMYSAEFAEHLQSLLPEESC